LEVDGSKILGREEIRAVAEVAGLAVDFQRVGKPASLGTFAAVGAAAAEDFAGEALARVRDAEGSVDKDLQGEAVGVGRGGELGQLPQGKLPGENGEVEALPAGEGDSLGRGEGHLGGGVEFHPRADGPGEADEAEVLHDEGIHPGGGGEPDEAYRLWKFGGKNQHIHGEVAPSTAGTEVGHHFRQVLFREVFGAEAGVESGQAEINGIGPGRNGGLEAVPVSGWGEKFGTRRHALKLGQGEAENERGENFGN
jgi:hypothetical protein